MTQLFLVLFLGGLRGWEWIIIIVAVLVLFGGKKIPDLMRNIGKGVHGFKEGFNNMKDEINKPVSPSDNESDNPDKDHRQ